MEWDSDQLEVIDSGLERILVIAPAGSGKTEVLAVRAASLAKRGLIQAPSQMLALTFTNRAVDNLNFRLRRAFGVNFEKYVSVHNFHGFAARLITAHGRLIGLDTSTLIWPEAIWLDAQFAGMDFPVKKWVKDTLADAKKDAAADVEVMERLEASGCNAAVQYEIRLRTDNRLDFDDVLRNAERLLGIEEITKSYRDRFPVIFVDEIQDLTLQELRFVRKLCGEATTAAGDMTQSIFRFKGAEPERSFEAFSEDAKIIHLRRSYRSAPAILRVVNALSNLEGATPVECADPSKFPDEGVVAVLSRRSVDLEAADLLDILLERALLDPQLSVGVIFRGGQRAAAFERTCTLRAIPYQSWILAAHDPEVVSLIRRFRSQATGAGPLERVDRLRSICLAEAPDDDFDLRNDLEAAFAAINSRIESGVDLEQALDECRTSGTRDQPIGPGLHVLNGHKGKGQQFDWVVILGAEDQNIPAFYSRSTAEIEEERRIFGVMASRARYGLIVTNVDVEEAGGRTRTRTPSRWLEVIRPHVTETM